MTAWPSRADRAGRRPGPSGPGAAYVELFLQDNTLTRGPDRWRQKLGSAGKTLFAAGAATLGAGAAVASLLGLAAKTAESRVEMGRPAAKVGENVTTLSRFAYAAETTGLSLQNPEGGWEHLSERIARAAKGSGEASDACRELGLNARSLPGQGRVGQFLTIADAYERVTNATSRNAIQSGLGGDQFQKFNALFSAGRSQIEKLMREAGDVAATQTEAQTKAAMSAQLAWFRVKTAVTGVFKAIGDAVLGPSETIEDLADRFVNAVKAVRLFVQNNRGLVRGVFLTAVAVMTVGAALVGLGAVLSAAGTGLGVLKAGVVGVPAAAELLFAALSGGFSFLLSPVGLFAAAVAGLGYLFLTQTEAGRGSLKDIGERFAQTGANTRAAWAGIVDAVKAGDLELAWATATAFPDLEWKRLWAEAKRVASEGWDFLGGGWRSAVLVVKTPWVGLKEFLVTTSLQMAAAVLRGIAQVATGGEDVLAGLVEKVNPNAAVGCG